MCSEGRHFRTHRIDSKRNTQDSGVMAAFEGESGEMEDYCGIINNILKIDYRTFHIFVLGMSSGLKNLYAKGQEQMWWGIQVELWLLIPHGFGKEIKTL